MGIWNLQRWLSDRSRPIKKTVKGRKPLTLRLNVESLEDRVVPATFTWTGLGPDANFSDGANWVGGVAPINALSSNFDQLVFGTNALASARTPNNDLTGVSFYTVTISADSYAIGGNQLILGTPGDNTSGFIVVNNGAKGDSITTDLLLQGGTAGGTQDVTVNAGSDLLLSGNVSGTTGVQLTKKGTGTLSLSGDNSGFTGPIQINDNSGIVIVSSATALGSASVGVVIRPQSTLMISGLAAPLFKNFTIGGLGTDGEGALVNLSGNNVINGNIILDASSDIALGSKVGTLQINGVISDTGAGRNLVKEGVGTVDLTAVNTYRGLTKINNGILEIQNNFALGTQTSASDGTIVNETRTPAGAILKAGTLQLAPDLNGNPLQVRDEQLTLNGLGANIGTLASPVYIGALNNLTGNNEYAANVTLGSPSGFNVLIGVEAGSQLLISGVVSGTVNNYGGTSTSTIGTEQLTKGRTGRLIFDNANTYTGDTLVNEGTLTVRDSKALGASSGNVGVNSGATVELEVDGLATSNPRRPTDPLEAGGSFSNLDPHGRDRGVDSVTGVANMLSINKNFYLSGSGVNNLGALRSRSGINTILGSIDIDEANLPPRVVGLGGPRATLENFVETATTAIGVDPDPIPTPSAAYFTNDYSLAVSGVIRSDNQRTLQKVGTGQLKLSGNNTYLATTDIRQGWITAQSPNALGAYDPTNGETAQKPTFVRAGAALHLKALTPTGSFNLNENKLILQGSGITHPYSLISGQGALMNVGGTNTASGDIQLNGQVGIGVELTDVGSTSELTLTGKVTDFSGFNVATTSEGGPQENSNIIDTGATSGTLIITYDLFVLPDRVRVYYPPRGFPGSALLFDSGFVGTPGGPVTKTIPFNGTSTLLEIVINEGGNPDPNTLWEYTGQIVVNTPGSINKLGSKRLRLQGAGTYTGADTVSQGVLTVQNDTALGAASGGATTVMNGTAVELDQSLASNNGGISAGIQVQGKGLILNGTGITGFVNPDGTVVNIQPLTAKNGDHMWRGPLSLNNDVNIDVQTNSRLNMYGVIDDTGSLFPAGWTKLGTGELTLNGTNTYRGVTNIQQGVVTILNGSALGTTDGGTVVSTGASLQVQGNITIAGESLTLAGDGTGTVPSTVPIRWFADGPAPIQNGQTPGNLDVSGRVTGVTVDPSDSNVIYISTAGGGAWKTKDGGKTWVPLLDNIIDASGNPINAQTLFTGSIAVSQTNAQTMTSLNRFDFVINSTANIDLRKIYVGTGEGNNSFDSYYGRGVLRSTDSGRSWTQIGPVIGGVYVFDKKAINKIVVDPNDSDIIYVAVGNPASGGPTGAARANNGIWRYNANLPAGVGAGKQWQNLTSTKSPLTRSYQFSDFDNYTDVDVKISPAGFGFTDARIVTMAIGDATGQTFDPITGAAVNGGTGGANYLNGMYISQDSGTTWSDTGFAFTQQVTIGGLTLNFPVAGNVRVALSNQIQVLGDNLPDNLIAYASVSYPSQGFNTTYSSTFGFTPEDGNPNLENRLLGVYRSTINWNNSTQQYDFGTWTLLGSPDYMSNISGALNRGRGDYTNAIAVDPSNANTVYVAGVDQTLGKGVLESVNGGAFQDIGVGADGKGPHSYAHGFTFDANGKLYVATDGGLYSLENPTPGSAIWGNRNGNLAITQFNSVSTNQFNLYNAIGGSQSNGVDLYTGNPAWTQTDNGNGGQVLFDPKNPQIVYSIVEGPGTTVLRKSTQGGVAGSWTTLFILSAPAPATPLAPNRNGNVFPNTAQSFGLAIDKIQTSRILVGGPGDTIAAGVGRALRESTDGGATFNDLGAPITANFIALATFQGPFAADAGFPQVADIGANTYNPDTIYITNGTQVAVTKNHGISWVTRNPGVTNIQKIIVDPRNRDTIYVISSNFTGPRILMSTDAGRTFTDLTANLPTDLPVYAIVLDPRTGSSSTTPTGDLYIGTDNGVYVRKAGSATWSRFGQGMPNVQVKDLELNLGQNTLNAGTYGRSLFTYYLPDVQLNGGALRAVSGNSVWTGNITLAGTPGASVSIGAGGGQTLADGSATAKIDITGSISDATGTTHDVNKIGGGTVVFSGSNSYSGVTKVRNGVLVANNANSLGSSTAGTIVQADAGLTAALQLSANLNAEPITLFGDGFSLNGHNTGALRSISNNNTYTGPLTLATNATIGVDSGSQLTMTGPITDGGAVRTLTKELTGTLVLSGSSTYSGTTFIDQGAIQATTALSLGAPSSAAQILDGAQLQLAGNNNLQKTIQASGTGINNSGAILNVTGNNTITGTVTLTSLPNFSPATTPTGVVWFGVAGANDTLTINGSVAQQTAQGITNFGLDKIGAGRLTLASADSYGGQTRVRFGTLRIRNGAGLGSTSAGTDVSPGAVLELDGNISVGNEALRLNYYDPNVNGLILGDALLPRNQNGALQSVTGNSTYGGSVLLATDTEIGGTPGSSVTITGVVSDPTLSALNKVGQNTVNLAAANTYRGLTSVNNGILGISNPSALGATTAGTLVNNGGTLQMSGGITVTGEDLTINGAGFNGIGALNNLSGTNDYSRLITLGSNSSLGSTAGTLNLDQPLTDGTNTFGVTKVGTGTVAYIGSTSNLYKGTTTVNDGTLLLNKSGGAVPFINGLVIGNGDTVPGIVQLGQSNQIPVNALVTVNSDGLLNLAGFSNTVNNLTVLEGIVNTGTGGTLTTSNLSMTGGTVTAGASGSVVLSGDVSATSDAAQVATINALGTGATLGKLSLGGATRTFNVAKGAQRVDLAVNAPVVDQAGEGLAKSGAGRMALNSTSTYAGLTTLNAGDFEVNGSTGNVLLNNASATLSGTGSVGTVTGFPSAIGTVDPGQNVTGAAGTVGTINTGSLTLGSSTVLNFNLVSLGSADKIFSTGAVSLGGATLSGTVGAGVNVGDQFTIIQTSGTPITGRFAEPFGPGVAFIAGRKFNVDYTDPTKVVLTLVQTTVSVKVASGANPTVYGQTLTFGATVVAEAGTTATPTGTVTFSVIGPSGTLTQTVGLNSMQQALDTITQALLPGTYTVNVTYNGDTNFNGAAGTLSPLQVVVPSGTSVSLSSTPNPSNFGSAVTISATVVGTFNNAIPSGTVSFSINGGTATTVALVNGKASITTSSLPRGSNSISVTYNGDDPTGGFNASSKTGSTFVNPPGTVPPPGGGSGGGGGGSVGPRVDLLTKQLVAYGAEGGGSHVRVVNTQTGAEILSIFAYNPLYTGGVRVALGDVNGDGTIDLITGTGPGGGPHVKVFDGATGAERLSFYAFDPLFTGGISVASADVFNLGYDDIIVGAGSGAGPAVKVFDGKTGAEVASFYAYAPNFTGGVNVAGGDVNGDGYADIITGSAALATHVKVFDGKSLLSNPNGPRELQSFYAFEPVVTGGVNVSVGDINGDGLADIIASPGSGGPRVRVLRGYDLTELASFFAFDQPVQKGLRVAAVDPNRVGKSEIVVGEGFGGHVRRFDAAGNLLDDTLPFDVTPIGVFVG